MLRCCGLDTVQITTVLSAVRESRLIADRPKRWQVTKQIILSSDADVAFTPAQLVDLERLLSLRGNVQAIREGLQV